MSKMNSSWFDDAYLADVETLNIADEADQGQDDRRQTTDEDE